MDAIGYIESKVFVKVQPSKISGVGVFAIRDWYKVEKSNSLGFSGKLDRWGFNGEEASPDIMKLYLNKSIKHIKKRGAANPIRYSL